MVIKNKYTCKFCEKAIDEKEKHVLVSTRFGDGTEDNIWFHWKCWISYFKECVKRKSADIVTRAGGVAGEMVRNMMQNMGFLR